MVQQSYKCQPYQPISDKGPSQPIHHSWDQVVGTSKGRCINEYRFFVGSGSANIVLNILVFILVCDWKDHLHL